MNSGYGPPEDEFYLINSFHDGLLLDGFQNVQSHSSFVDRQPSSFGGYRELSDNVQSHSSFVDRQPSSFGGYQQSSSFGGYQQSSSFVDPLPSFIDSFLRMLSPRVEQASIVSTDKLKQTNRRMPRKSSFTMEQLFKQQPLFSMKRLEQYVHLPNEELLVQLAKSHYDEDNLPDMIDPALREQMDPLSFKIFSETAYTCLKEQRAQRPNIDHVLRNLEKALEYQTRIENPPQSTVADEVDRTSPNRFKGGSLEHLKIPLADIEFATEKFTKRYLGSGAYGKVYGAELDLPIEEKSKGDISKKQRTVAIKCITKDKLGKEGFVAEIELLTRCKHENIVSLLGFCDEGHELILVYEHVTNGSLDDYLGITDKSTNLTWVQRLKICIDIARGLNYLHTKLEDEQSIIHRDIKSGNILLGKNWVAKIADFGLSRFHHGNQEDKTHYSKNIAGTEVYMCPEYRKEGKLKRAVDIYSFGVVLFEILSGKLAYDKTYTEKNEYGIAHVARRLFNQGTLNEMVDSKIMEEVDELTSTFNKGPNQDSLQTFIAIARRCVAETQNKRPTAEDILEELEKALSFQEDSEIWKAKLPDDYEELIKMSKSSSIYSNETKKNLYTMFSKGILLQNDKVWFTLGSNGERNEMISARKFSYRNRSPHEWQSVSQSRFPKVAKMLDISNMMIKIKAKPQFLSPAVVYGVHLIFKFCDSRKFSSEPMYVHLKYRNGNKPLHAYFATRRDEEWMMIELQRFLNQKESMVFKFIVESFSPYYCGDGAIYVEGIEFRAIENGKPEELEKLQEQVLETTVNVDQVQQLSTSREEIYRRSKNYDANEKLFWPSQVNGKKHLMLSAKAALNDFSNLKLLASKPPIQSRFREVIELLPQQVFHINCSIKSQKLSQATNYLCYLVFKVSEICLGLHGPVKVLELLHQENKEAEIIYFISPSPWNLHKITRVPKQREDGWMEVNVWKFNSNIEVKNDRLPVRLKLISYEGTMSGLIICGLEFRTM